jgi:hypothetical protein
MYMYAPKPAIEYTTLIHDLSDLGHREYQKAIIVAAINEARRDFADVIINCIDPDRDGKSAIRRIEELLNKIA